MRSRSLSHTKEIGKHFWETLWYRRYRIFVFLIIVAACVDIIELMIVDDNVKFFRTPIAFLIRSRRSMVKKSICLAEDIGQVIWIVIWLTPARRPRSPSRNAAWCSSACHPSVAPRARSAGARKARRRTEARPAWESTCQPPCLQQLVEYLQHASPHRR